VISASYPARFIGASVLRASAGDECPADASKRSEAEGGGKIDSEPGVSPVEEPDSDGTEFKIMQYATRSLLNPIAARGRTECRVGPVLSLACFPFAAINKSGPCLLAPAPILSTTTFGAVAIAAAFDDEPKAGPTMAIVVGVLDVVPTFGNDVD
jgi:hypothetical protein